MKTSPAADPRSLTPLRDEMRRERPEVAAVLLQRLEHALEPARATTGEHPAKPTPAPALAQELVSLLDRWCSGLYVGDRSAAQQRVLLALDGVLAGAAAEIVRDGVHLVIRLHARDAAAHRIMQMGRDELGRSLREQQRSDVVVEVAPLGAIAHAQRE